MIFLLAVVLVISIGIFCWWIRKLDAEILTPPAPSPKIEPLSADTEKE